MSFILTDGAKETSCFLSGLDFIIFLNLFEQDFNLPQFKVHRKLICVPIINLFSTYIGGKDF